MSDSETSAKTEARELIRRLHDAGIWLRFDGDQIKWSTHTAQGLTIADVCAIKRLTPELKPLLAAIGSIDEGARA